MIFLISFVCISNYVTLHLPADGGQQEVEDKAELRCVEFQLFYGFLLCIGDIIPAFVEEFAQNLAAAGYPAHVAQVRIHRQKERNHQTFQQPFICNGGINGFGRKFLVCKIFADVVLLQSREIELFKAVLREAHVDLVRAAGQHDSHVRTILEKILYLFDDELTDNLCRCLAVFFMVWIGIFYRIDSGIIDQNQKSCLTLKNQTALFL